MTNQNARVFLKENTNLFFLLLLTGLFITITCIVFRSQFISVLPLYVSLFIMLLQSKANRLAPLMGGLNSILYAFIYIKMGLYSTVIHCLFFSFPIQLATFIRWNKNKYGSSTIFRKLNLKARVLISISLLVVFVLQVFVMNKIGANNTVLDSISSLLGILISILTLLSFIEYSWLSLVSGLVNIMLFTSIVITDTSKVPFLIYSIYAYVCMIRQFISVRFLFNEQKMGVKTND